MKVVVTGSTGRLGRVVVPALRAAGHEVVALARLDADLTDDAAVGVLASHLGPAVALVHLAALHPADPARTTAADRRKLVDTNVHGTMRVLEACRDAGAARIVFASTQQVFGGWAALEAAAIPGGARIAEVDAMASTLPPSDFAATKLAGEDHLRVLREEAGVPFVVLRFPALVEPGLRGADGTAGVSVDAAAAAIVRAAEGSIEGTVHVGT